MGEPPPQFLGAFAFFAHVDDWIWTSHDSDVFLSIFEIYPHFVFFCGSGLSHYRGGVLTENVMESFVIGVIDPGPSISFPGALGAPSYRDRAFGPSDASVTFVSLLYIDNFDHCIYL